MKWQFKCFEFSFKHYYLSINGLYSASKWLIKGLKVKVFTNYVLSGNFLENDFYWLWSFVQPASCVGRLLEAPCHETSSDGRISALIRLM